MTTDDLSAYKELYIKTSGEYLEAIQASIVLLTADPVNKGAIEVLYRSAHSLKSQSMIMGYKNTMSLCNFLEATFRNIKEGKETVTEKMKEVKEAIHMIRESLNNIETLDKEISLSEPVTN